MKKSVKYVVPFGVIVLAAVFLLPLKRANLPNGYWLRSDFDKVYPRLNKQTNAYSAQLRKKDVIADKRIVMKSWKSNVRESLLGNFQFGKTETTTVIVGYIQRGDAENIFPPLETEHLITVDNVDDFQSWLTEKVDETDSQQLTSGKPE